MTISCASFAIQDIHNYFNTDNLLPRDDATKEVVWHDRHQLFKRCLCLFGQSVDRSVPMFVILCMLPYAWGSGVYKCKSWVYYEVRSRSVRWTTGHVSTHFNSLFFTELLGCSYNS